MYPPTLYQDDDREDEKREAVAARAASSFARCLSPAIRLAVEPGLLAVYALPATPRRASRSLSRCFFARLRLRLARVIAIASSPFSYTTIWLQVCCSGVNTSTTHQLTHGNSEGRDENTIKPVHRTTTLSEYSA
jgi:hypothetical protein